MNEVDKQDSKDTDYLIPQNVSAKTEIFPGIGWKELGVILLATALGFLIFLILGLPQKEINSSTDGISMVASESPQQTASTGDNAKNDTSVSTDKDSKVEMKRVSVIAVPIRLLVVVAFAGMAYILVSRAGGTSLLEMLLSMIKFGQSRKLYYYKTGM